MKPRPGTASNIAWTSVGNGTSLVAGFASSVLLARWLGPEARGVYALILTTSVTLAAILGNNAWVQALAFLAGKQRYSPSQIAGHSLLIVLTATAVLIVPLLLSPNSTIDSLFPDLHRGHLWLVVLVTASTLLLSALTGLLMGLNQIPLLISLGTARTVVALLLQLVLLGILSMGLLGALWELVISALLITSAALAIFIRKSGIDLKVERSFLKEFMLYSGKTYPGHIGLVLFSRVDLYFVALFGGFEAAGIYAVAKGLTEIVAIIEQSLSQGIMPKVIAGDFAAASAVVARAFRITFWLNALLLLAGALTAHWLVPLVYGAEFAPVVPALLLLMPGTLFLTTRILGTFFAMQIGRPEIPTYYVLASGLVSLPLSYWLTRQFGYLGASAAFSIVAVMRGIVAIILFVVFSKIKVKDVLLLGKDDLMSLSHIIRPWLKARAPREQRS
jgi:O-antigen/teichoic acid export membrane protein